MNQPGSNPKVGKPPQAMADQRPRFEQARLFRKALKPGRPALRRPRQFWVK